MLLPGEGFMQTKTRPGLETPSWFLFFMVVFFFMALPRAGAQAGKDTTVSWIQIPALTIKADERPFLVKVLSFDAFGSLENSPDSAQWQDLLVSANGCRIGNGMMYRFNAIIEYHVDKDGDVRVTYTGEDENWVPVELQFYSGAGLPFSTFSVGYGENRFSMYKIQSNTIRLLPLNAPAVKAIRPMPEGPDAAYFRALRKALPLQ